MLIGAKAKEHIEQGWMRDRNLLGNEQAENQKRKAFIMQLEENMMEK